MRHGYFACPLNFLLTLLYRYLYWYIKQIPTKTSFEEDTLNLDLGKYKLYPIAN